MSDIPRPPPPVTESVKARNESPLAQFSNKIGKSQVIEKEINGGNIIRKNSTLAHGFNCTTCMASFTSSDAYLDHCNGRIHQRNLGLSLKVERVVEVDRIKARLQELTQKRQATEQVIESKSVTIFEKQLDVAQAENDRIKEERKLKKKRKRNKDFDEELAGSSDFNETDDLDMIKLMGFQSFS